MAKSTASARQEKAASKSAWEPPYPDFPLSFHPPSGRLYKKIKGKRVYFGYASDWQSAVDKYGRQREDLYAGRKPRPERDGLPLVDLVNRFLTAKLHRVESGELTQRSWNDYKATCGRVLDCFGKRRVVEDLRAEDFETLRADLQKSRGLVALGNEIQRIRTLFKYGWDSDLIASPVKYGPDFKRPGKKARRRARNQREPLAYSPDEIHRMLEAATPQLRAMFLLAINTGMGNLPTVGRRVRSGPRLVLSQSEWTFGILFSKRFQSCTGDLHPTSSRPCRASREPERPTTSVLKSESFGGRPVTAAVYRPRWCPGGGGLGVGA
jgi:hypothetical protein